MSAQSLKIGFARLSDCAPLVAAKERGEFDQVELDVTLRRFPSWAAMRDALAQGVIDAAHMLAPMVVASAAGLSPYPGAFTTSFAMNLNGNAITVSNALLQELCEVDPDCLTKQPLVPNALKILVDRRKQAGQEPLTFAYVYNYSMHSYELQYWLRSMNIDPINDVKLVVIPPEQMVMSLRNGLIDGYCVGEPWNTAAIHEGLGKTLITSGEIWNNAPEKVLAVRSEWSKQNEDVHIGLIKALLKASIWLDRTENRVTAANMVAATEYLDLPVSLLLPSLTGRKVQTGGTVEKTMRDFCVFHRYAANFPWRSHAKWIYAQMARVGESKIGLSAEEIVEAAYEPRHFRKACSELDIACPTIDYKLEGAHAHPWLLGHSTKPIAMGSDLFLDEQVFDPDQAIKSLKH